MMFLTLARTKFFYEDVHSNPRHTHVVNTAIFPMFKTMFCGCGVVVRTFPVHVLFAYERRRFSHLHQSKLNTQICLSLEGGGKVGDRAHYDAEKCVGMGVRHRL